MIRYFASHPTAGNLLMLSLIAIGLAAVPTLKRETFPEIPPDEIEVRVPYPGASAEDVEEAVCRRVEDAVEGIGELDEVRCESREGIGEAVVVMREGGDFNRFLNDVKTEVEAIDTFPEEVETPVIRQIGIMDFVASIAVTGPMSTPDLKAYCEDLKDRLMLLEEITLVDVLGFSDHQIRIEVPAHTLRQYGLSVEDIAGVVARQSVDLPSGTIETTEQDVLLRFADERHSPHEFEDLVVVAGASGAEIRLGDIATITDRFERDEDKIVFNGRRAGMLQITKTKEEDTLTAVAAAKAFLERERQTAPPGVAFALTQDISSIVRDRLNLLIWNGTLGLVLVFLTMWLFFGFRYSFWVAAGLPVSFLGAIFAMFLLDYSFNMITMVGLLIAIGLLMDDAIVISENIATQMRKGKPPLDAAVDGAKQVAPGVIASFMTTIAVFGSLAFMKGDIGTVLKAMPVVLIATLAVSLVEAFLILPHHLTQSLRRAQERRPSAFRLRFDNGLEWAREHVLGRAIDVAVSWRYLFIGLVIAVFLGSMGMVAAGTLKFRVFPDIDGDVIEARILLPQGTPLARTEEVAVHVTSALERVNESLTPEQPQGRPLVRNVNVQFNKNIDSFEAGPHVATVSVDLLGAEERSLRADEVLARWREQAGVVADVININFKEFQVGPGGLPIDIRLRGPDLAELKVAALELQGWLGAFRGVFDLSDDLRPGKPEVRLRLREGAMALGLDAAGIASQLRSAFHGRTASEIQVGAESYEIDVRLSALDQDSLADLEYFSITSAQGRQIPLGTVATLEFGRGPARIAHVDGQRTVTVRGDVDTTIANANEIITETRERFLPGFLARHPSVRVSFEGQAKEGETTGTSVRTGFLIGITAVFVLMSFMFRSYVEPLIVLAAIPLGFVGVVWGHILMGLEISMPSVVGFVSLAGVVVNDSILLVEFIKLRGREGRSVHDAVRIASRERFRAVLLTSLTTVAGLLPLLAERSLQAQVLVPLVASLVFGIVASTLLVLLVIPVLYAILEDFGLTTFEAHAAQAPAE
jgi:multidrug efflux pump subunit AcrB